MSMACKSKHLVQSNPQILDKIIFQTWVHEGEKDSMNIRQYRPATYTLPRARGRQIISFESNGTVMLQDIAPTDGLVTFEGKWKVLANGSFEIIFPQKPERNFTFEIVTLEKELLRIKNTYNN
jgi:hypothetical protein